MFDKKKQERANKKERKMTASFVIVMKSSKTKEKT